MTVVVVVVALIVPVYAVQGRDGQERHIEDT